MSTNASRLPLLIDVFELKAQPALALASLLPDELITGVLDEFRLKGQHAVVPSASAPDDAETPPPPLYRDLEYLSHNASDYQLCKANGGSALDDQRTLGDQLVPDAHLTLRERDVALPAGTARPACPIYLREQANGAVYRLMWMPAIIGRPDADQEHNHLVAVNLAAYMKGQHVSRRHVRIFELNGQFYAKPLSSNPTSLLDADEIPQPISQEGVAIHHGDVLYLDTSKIALKVILRTQEGEG